MSRNSLVILLEYPIPSLTHTAMFKLVMGKVRPIYFIGAQTDRVIIDLFLRLCKLRYHL